MPRGVQQNIQLGPYTTLHVGGVADYLCEIETLEELKAACQFALQTDKPLLILGGGSNVLISDEGFPGLVILVKNKGINITPEEDGNFIVRAQAGEDWDSLVQFTVDKNLSGLENLSGIPGTVGASPVQNINAYGAAVSDTIFSVEVFDYIKNEVRTLSAEECRFGYRDSIFKQADGSALIVISVSFRLANATNVNLIYHSSSQSISQYLKEKQITKPTLQNVRDAVLNARSNIGMLVGQFRSAGSFFKNTIVSHEIFSHVEKVVNEQYSELGSYFTPWNWTLPNNEVKISTAFLMECSPYNKRTCSEQKWNGVVGISPKHSLSIITYEGATAVDVLEFVNEIKLSVKNIFGVTIESEVIFL